MNIFYLVLGSLLISSCFFIVALLGLIGSIVILTRKPASPGMSHYLQTGILAGLIIVSSIAVLAGGVRLLPFRAFVRPTPAAYTPPVVPPKSYYFDASDPEVRPFIDAIKTVDRATLGFTPIPPHTPITITRITGSTAEYDVDMHVFGATIREIAFKRDGQTYVWVAEQEIHTGPNSYNTGEGGLTQEQITVMYDTVSFSGSPRFTTTIIYFGRDPRLYDKTELTLRDVLPILREWDKIRLTITPTP